MIFCSTDWHVGISIGDYDRKADILWTIDQIKKLILKHKPDMFIHCGDFFHTNRNLSENIKIFIEFCDFLVGNGIAGYFLVGNHDLVEQEDKTHALDIQREGIYVIDTISVVGNLLFIPHLSRSKSEKSPEQLLDEIADSVDGGDKKYWVFSHCNVNHIELPNQIILKYNHHALPEKLVKSKNVLGIFNGHMHRPQDGLPGQPNFYNIGTPQRFSIDEKDDVKRVFTLNPESGDTEFIPLQCTEFDEINLDFCGEKEESLKQFDMLMKEPEKLDGHIVKIIGRIKEEDMTSVDMNGLKKVLSKHVAYLYNSHLSIVREKRYRLKELSSKDDPDKAIEKFCEKYDKVYLVELAKTYKR